jgi:hypothetical protein
MNKKKLIAYSLLTVVLLLMAPILWSSMQERMEQNYWKDEIARAARANMSFNEFAARTKDRVQGGWSPQADGQMVAYDRVTPSWLLNYTTIVVRVSVNGQSTVEGGSAIAYGHSF